MSNYTMIPNLAEQEILADGILSRTVYKERGTTGASSSPASVA
jgi:hypothetical protein